MTLLVSMMSMFSRLRVHLFAQPAILAAAASRIVLPGGRTPLSLTLRGWGWLAAIPAGTAPRRQAWRFFKTGRLQVLVPVGEPVSILTRNCFGRSGSTWYPVASTVQESPVAPKPKQRVVDMNCVRPPQGNVLRLPLPDTIAFSLPAPKPVAVVLPKARGLSMPRMHPAHFAIPALPFEVRRDLADAGTHAKQAAAAVEESVAVLAHYDKQ
ncbi:hypothetical protein [Noviherbaspirillum pedocola]|uniref:Uncharacterized protein n=1 Tax=Noviherbaspirillum pedocola TaxID=2801341 RepID=A0A934W800_9BURK|nr:hypothetical protein [Noviherbaspirillum pedocola]MBK4735249.1 hypothetical protein [Noviherbaspirillum pedocola]